MTEQRTSRPLRGEDTIVFFLLIFLCFHMLSVLLNAVGLLGHLAGLEQWLLIAVPTLLFVKLRGLPMRETLRLRPMSAPSISLSIVFALGLIGAGMVLTSLQEMLLMNFEWYQERMAIWDERLSATPDQPLLWLMLTVAVTPAICEEIVFRGVIITAASRDLSTIGVCVVSGVLFGVFHGDPVQLVLTALMGGGLAWLVITTGSLVAGVIAHFLFNATTLLLRHFVSAEPMETASASDLLGLFVVALIAAALIALSAKGLKNLKKSPATGNQTAMGVNNT